VDDSVPVRCPKCKGKFRDRARRLVTGYSRQCPLCEVMIFFEDASPSQDIKDALKKAERVRRALREEDQSRPRRGRR
jgi:hypothetical protein